MLPISHGIMWCHSSIPQEKVYETLRKKHARCVLVVAIMTPGISLAAQGAERHLGPTPFDSDILEQAMALYGLNEDGAIKRLAAESEAVDMYRRVTSMALAGYAGA